MVGRSRVWHGKEGRKQGEEAEEYSHRRIRRFERPSARTSDFERYEESDSDQRKWQKKVT